MAKEYESVEVRQMRGPVLAFDGTLLAETEWETRGGDKMVLKVWETRGGAWVAVSEMTPQREGAAPDIRGLVVPSGGNEVARQCAVLDHFGWEHRARAMLRKQLGWAPRVEIK